MTQGMNASKGKWKGFLLVRDCNGKPKFADIFNIAPEFWKELTEEEKEVIIQERIDDRNPSCPST